MKCGTLQRQKQTFFTILLRYRRMTKRDFYEILGIGRSASEQEIKQAYRKLSRELHPDKHKGDKEKEARFKEVNQAYEVLSDPKKKQMYDQFGSADGAQFGGGQGFGGFDFSGFQQGGFDSSQFEGLGDLFESFFSGAGGGRSRRASQDGRDVQVGLNISLAEAVLGAKRDVTFEVPVRCEDCKGTGAAEGSKTVNCAECSGKGSILKTARSLFGTIQQSVLCPHCQGSGNMPEKPCKTCGGEGRKSKRKTVAATIPPGIDTGQALKISGEGEAGRQGAPSGDLLVRITVEPDERFQRDGDDVRSLLDTTVADAALGAAVMVETVQGPISVNIPAGTQPGQVLRVKGKGMPILNAGRHGDHYVTINVVVPAKLTKEQRRLFEELKKASN